MHTRLTNLEYLELGRRKRATYFCHFIYRNPLTNCPHASYSSSKLGHKKLQVLSSRSKKKKNFSKLPISLNLYASAISRGLSCKKPGLCDKQSGRAVFSCACLTNPEMWLLLCEASPSSGWMALWAQICPSVLPFVCSIAGHSFISFVRTFSHLSLVMSIDVLLLFRLTT